MIGRALPAITAAQRPAGFVPVIGLGAGYVLHEIHAEQAGPRLRFGLQRADIEHAVRIVADDAFGRAAEPDTPRQLPCVDTGNADQVAARQPVVQRPGRAEIGRLGDRFAQNEAARRHRRGLDVFLVGADIADMREGESDDLTGIGGIRQDLLIAGHRCVEADFPDGRACRADAMAVIDRAVLQNQYRRRRLFRHLGGRLGQVGHLVPGFSYGLCPTGISTGCSRM